MFVKVSGATRCFARKLAKHQRSSFRRLCTQGAPCTALQQRQHMRFSMPSSTACTYVFKGYTPVHILLQYCGAVQPKASTNVCKARCCTCGIMQGSRSANPGSEMRIYADCHTSARCPCTLSGTALLKRSYCSARPTPSAPKAALACDAPKTVRTGEALQEKAHPDRGCDRLFNHNKRLQYPLGTLPFDAIFAMKP